MSSNSVKSDCTIANSKVNNIKQLISFCNTNWSKLLNVHLCQENKPLLLNKSINCEPSKAATTSSKNVFLRTKCCVS